MTEQIKKPSGVLFKQKNKTKESQPDFTGNIELSTEMIKNIVAVIKSDMERYSKEHFKLDLACWENIAASGQPYMKAQATIPRKKGGLDDEIPF